MVMIALTNWVPVFLASFFSIFFMPERKVWDKTESALSNKLQSVSHIRMIYVYDRKI